MKLIQYTTPTLSTWTPFNRLAPFQDLLDSALDSSSRSGTRVPPMEILESEDALTVRLELGGMKKEDFDISLEDDTLTVSGQRNLDTGKDRSRSELFQGAFSRTITLPCPVQSDKVKAIYQDGILGIELPKVESIRPRKIAVD
jgi:HSP20 family protein